MDAYAKREALHFFKDRHATFVTTLDVCKASAVLADSLFDTADAQFESRLGATCHGADPIACHKGCATCCSLRVTATAPEVLRIAKHLREAVAPDVCRRLVLRLLEADGLTRDLDEAGRAALRHRCPFIEKGACVIYPVRPLACRGHASHSKQACIDAARGRAHSVPFSVAHRDARSLVQNALQSAMRDTGLAWASYELNHALRIALSVPESERGWLQGSDVFAAAAVHEVSAAEMAAGFDAIKALP